MSVRRVLVLGAGGMLGHKMLQVLTPRFPEVWGTVRSARDREPAHRLNLVAADRMLDGVDAAAFERLEALLRELRPDAVINCVGVIKQRPDAHSAIPSITINSLLPHRLAATLAHWGGRLIHFSTDCVFDGTRGNYTESDLPTAADLYGRSKALGEVTVANALTLRTSIIGRELRHGHSLLEWFLGQAPGTVRGFRRAWWSGVTTNHLAEIVAGLLIEQPDLSGLYHLSSGRISKYELLCRLRDAYRLDVEVEPADEFACDRSLVGERFETATGYRFPGWDSVLEQLAADPTPYEEWAAA